MIVEINRRVATFYGICGQNITSGILDGLQYLMWVNMIPVVYDLEVTNCDLKVFYLDQCRFVGDFLANDYCM